MKVKAGLIDDIMNKNYSYHIVFICGNSVQTMIGDGFNWQYSKSKNTVIDYIIGRNGGKGVVLVPIVKYIGRRNALKKNFNTDKLFRKCVILLHFIPTCIIISYLLPKKSRRGSFLHAEKIRNCAFLTDLVSFTTVPDCVQCR